MLRRCAPVILGVCFLLLVPGAGDFQAAAGRGVSFHPGSSRLNLYMHRASPLDLEVSGELPGLPPEAKRYVARTDLLALPQVRFQVSDDANFVAPVDVQGVELGLLGGEITAKAENVLIIAICGDYYRGFYPADYIRAHKPALALDINGQGPPGWPKSREGTNSAMGPFLITHPRFAPNFKILAHSEEPQIPWGVVRLEFRNEKSFYDGFAPHGAQAGHANVQAGYRIAMQNCLRCHFEGKEPSKGKMTWSALGMLAGRAPKQFAAYVKNPQSIAQDAEMPANPAYDEVTLQALAAYFRTFDPAAKE